MDTRFVKVGGGVTAHSHVRLQFRYLGNRSALTLKPHQKQTCLFRARSFIAKHGVLLVNTDVVAIFQQKEKKKKEAHVQTRMSVL